ncbi:conserved hypothetical protein [Trichormus variabilis ATCC 29413]|uniref:DUF5331 domain-containing protein n=2 Tax=Anabaena variabilis TaxID=264691 RepID=Q3MAN7_TRIV2|nr:MULTISPECIES: DUF5331 domain-containing protein [Nostocaceae]ABA21949.1 conserved hypothetical protein [Trichormus variabilis ATCC 29413]MBC1215572.1 DUF5331 domain-containing protein [Trichormus variabilis ARAD]MBC1257825.1 DUF5331 domain-containing protein [Trichormus variabilis V5]MBC1267597.1 DUF5331 domain-containing protein [Trichormus variabilis FSR]MBC1303561.1 DUF5331 domain-containing protein [Trichormus variabilis N2B]
MAFFNSFTDSIKQKWLQFFQANRDWIKLHMEVDSVYTPDGGKRPPSYLILGVVNALEPKLAQLMFPFSKLNPDADTLIEVLELNFDPDIVLGNYSSSEADVEKHHYEPTAEIEDRAEADSFTTSETNGFSLDSDNQTLIIDGSISSLNDLDEISVTNGTQLKDEFRHTTTQETEDFGDVNFDIATTSAGKLEEQILNELNTPDENAFSDVLSDVWGDETSLHKTEDNNDFLGEELPAGVFDESEIARLFPNT